MPVSLAVKGARDLKKLLILIGVIFFMGCAAAPVQRAEPKTMEFQQPFDKVWSAAVRIITVDNDLPIQVIEKDSGIITTDWVTYERPVKGMGEAFMISSSNTTNPNIQIRYKLNISIEKTDNGTEVYIRDHVERFSGMTWSVTNERPPALENIAADLAARLK